MVVRRRKKTTKYHSHVSHGGGSRKKRRGAGSRGGRGNAGSGKRASHKVAGSSRKLGSKGFTRIRNTNKINATNIGVFTLEHVEKLVVTKKAVKDGDTYSINLGMLGYTKLLGTGTTTLKLNITVTQCSASAAQKIQAAGGKVITATEPAVETKVKEAPVAEEAA
jgi:large subunit ribosomal protein L15